MLHRDIIIVQCCYIIGIYGETDSSNSSSNQEMIPLLKQLLGLLESGKPFVIGGDAAGRGGDTSIYMSNQPHG